MCSMSKVFNPNNTDAYSKNAKGIHLITMNTPNGQAVQILLEELKDAYGTEWTTTLVDIMTNEQKKEWFLRLDPNGIFSTASRNQYVFLTPHRPYPSPRRQHPEPSIPSHGDLSRAAV